MCYRNVCRICESDEELEMIFKDENAEILQMLRRFTSTSIHINDGLPQYLCPACVQQLRKAYKFKSIYEITFDKFKSKCLLQHRGINLVEGFSDKNPKTQLMRMIKRENTANNSATKSPDAQEHVHPTHFHQEDYKAILGSSVNGIVAEMRHRCTGEQANDSHGWNLPGWCMDGASEPSRSNISALSKEKLDSLYDQNAKDKNLQNLVNIEESREDYLEVNVVSESEADKLFKCAGCGKQWTGKNRSIKWYTKAQENIPVCDECDKISAKSKKPTSNEDIHLNSEQSQAQFCTREKYEKPFGKYKCEECGKFFNNRPTYKTHLALHLNPNRYKCDICSKVYRVAHRLKIHKATHLNPDMYKCEICGKSFADPQRMKTHIALHSNPDLYKCNECGKCFSQLHTYRNHLAIHFNPDLYKCDTCGQTFTAAQTLKEHMTKHAYPELLKCDECGKAFANARNLNSHKASHTGRNLYKCQECGKSFSRSLTYKNHLALHSNPDLHKCEICGKSFTVAYSLRSHRVIHLNPDLYKCEICGKSFTESRRLKAHKAIHSNPDLTKCNECGKTFNKIWHLRDHKALHSDPNIYTCKECGRSFPNSCSMRRHMKTHRGLECDNQYKCQECGKSFSLSLTYKNHLALHSNPDLNKCNECGKTFNRIWHLKDHKALHSDPNIYTCKKCGRSLSNSCSMRRHMKTHRELDCDSNLTDTAQNIAVQEHPPLPTVSLSTN